MADQGRDQTVSMHHPARWHTGTMLCRREFLALGAVATGGALLRGWGAPRHHVRRQAQLVFPVVDQLVLTNVVDNTYDIFARAGQIGSVTVQRNPVPAPPQSGTPLLSEHGLAYHLFPSGVTNSRPCCWTSP